MEKEKLEQVALTIFDVIFGKEKKVVINGKEYFITKFSSGIKYLDAFGYRFIEQNRNKKSQWGKKAREGHQIMWVIKGRKYMAQILDGTFQMLD